MTGGMLSNISDMIWLGEKKWDFFYSGKVSFLFLLTLLWTCKAATTCILSLFFFFFFKGKYHWKKLISSNYFYITETVLSLKFILPLLSLSSNHPSKKKKKKKVCLIIDKVQFKYSGFQLNGTSVTRNSCLVDQSCKNKRMYIFAPFYANLFKKNGHLWDHYL